MAMARAAATVAAAIVVATEGDEAVTAGIPAPPRVQSTRCEAHIPLHAEDGCLRVGGSAHVCKRGCIA
jgi:acyl CoA:acetate/3-ketoacid CoA transferase beta subunit